MNDKLSAALTEVETTYSELVDVANSILNPILGPINEQVEDIRQHINNLTTDQLRNAILQLQLRAFEISEIKEKAAMKAEIAEALQKEKFAINFNSIDGTAAVKDKLALVATSAETATEVLYSLISNLLKTKLDQLHRLVDSMKSVLMSRMQEVKFMNLGASSDVPAPKTANQSYTIEEV